MTDPRVLTHLRSVHEATLARLTAADVRTKAVLRSAIAGIACERFRQAHKRWPKELAEIPKDIL